MDLGTSLLCLGLVMGSALLLFIISTLGTRGQSYEEVVAESRRLAAQRGLLDEAARTKKAQQQLTKKNKKAGKKVKEKQAKEQQAATSNSELDSDAPAESGPEEDTPAHKQHGHVEFVETAVVVEPEAPPPKQTKAKKRGKEAKIKPILMNRDDPSCISDVSTPPSPTLKEAANHFEQIHPKDEFELFHFNDKEGVHKEKKESKSKHGKAKSAAVKQAPEPVEVAKVVEPAPEPELPKDQRKGKGKQQTQQEKTPEKLAEAVVTPSAAPSQPSNLTTDKILKKTYPLEGAAASVPPPPAAQEPLINGPSKGKKKKGDPLYQLTMGGDGLNVNMLVHVLTTSPLSRSEIQILTDCLLNKQNGPLPEHSEWSEGPKDPIAKLKKQLAEKEKALTDEQEASQAIQGKLKELRASLNAEISRSSRIAAGAEETANNQRIELAAVQSRLQRTTEEATILRQQLLQIQSKLSAEAEFTVQRSKMEMQIMALSENKDALQGELEELRAAHGATVNELHASRDKFSATQHHASELGRQLEEANRQMAELENQKLNAISSEQFVKQELMQANDRLKGLNDVQAELQHLSSFKSQSQQLSMQHEQKQEELDRQNQHLSDELKKVKSDRDHLNACVTQLKEELVAKSTPNGIATPEKDDTEIVAKAVAAACSELEVKHSQQLDSLQRQLDQYTDKNNELRTKNWKVMEAFQAAEKKLQSVDSAPKPADVSAVREAVEAATLSEQRASKEVLQRLFPSVAAKGPSHSEWLQQFSEQASRVLSQAQAPAPVVTIVQEDPAKKELEGQVTQLTALVSKYKRVIDDTEGVLSRLQNNVTQEEQRWAKQLLEKQQELDNLKKNTISKLEDKISYLEADLEYERELNTNLEHSGPEIIVSEEIDDLERLREDNACLTELDGRLHNSNLSLNGPLELPSIPLEHKPTKKRRSLAGWFRRKITFRRRNYTEKRVEDQEERRARKKENGLGRKTSFSSFLRAGSKTL